MKKCKAHKWSGEQPPQPNESYCTECGTLFTGRGSQRKHAAPTSILGDIAADLAGMAPDEQSKPVPGGGSRATMPVVQSAPLELVPEPAPTPKWCGMAGRRISQAFVMLVEGAALRFAKRQTAEPEDDDVKELGIALGEQMAIWFPDSDLTPATKIMIAAASVTATMIVGSTPIKPPVRSVSTPKPIEDVAPVEETPMGNGRPQSTAVKLPGGLL